MDLSFSWLAFDSIQKLTLSTALRIWATVNNNRASRQIKNDQITHSEFDIRTVSSVLGHFDAGFTLRTYTHATRQMQDQATETMGNFMAQVM